MRALLPLTLLLLPLGAFAQQDERLPDLTPREFEIRGELQVSLPDLERQPLRGFAPPPRTYVVPADRQAFVAPYAQRLDGLPDDPLRPPAAPSLVRAEPRIGQIDLLAGRYTARRGRLTLNTAGFGLDADYRGFSDFAPRPGAPDITTSADDFRGRMGFTGGNVLRYDIGVDAIYHEYGLLNTYGVSDAGRRLHGFGGEVGMRGTEAIGAPFTASIAYRIGGVRDQGPDIIFFDDADQQPGEDRLRVGGDVRVGSVVLDAGTAFSWYRMEQPSATPAKFELNATAFSAGAALDLALGQSHLSIGGRLLGVATDDGEATESTITGGPIVSFEAPLGGLTRVYASNRPLVEERSLTDLFRQNPYAQLGAISLPDVRPIDAEIGLEVQSPVVRVRGYGGAAWADSELYFRQEPASFGPISARAFFSAAYAPTRTLRGGADLTFYAPGNISISVGGEFRHARFRGDGMHEGAALSGEAVPFVAPLSAQASIAVPFAGARGMVQTTLYLENERPTGRGDETAPGWADLSIEAHYRFAGRFGLLARADHLAGMAEQWPDFPRPPAILTAGLRAGW